LFIFFNLGTSLGEKIRKQINETKTKIKSEINKYNTLRGYIDEPKKNNFPPISFESIVNAISDFWKSIDDTLGLQDNIPKDKLYDIIMNYCDLQRAKEEIELIPLEMKRIKCYWNNLNLAIDFKINELTIKKEVSIFEVIIIVMNLI
jgi:hypothetical protein